MLLRSVRLLSVCALLGFTSLLHAAVVLVPFSSEEGVARFARSENRVDFFPLAQHFRVQPDSITCGPTAALIVLNALRWNTDKAPLVALAPKYMSTMPEESKGKKFDPRIHGYAPASFFAEAGKVKSEAQVYGAPIAVDPSKPKVKTADHGIQLSQLERMLNAVNGIKAEKHVVGTKESADKPVAKEEVKKITEILAKNLANKNDYVLVNFARKALDQKGGGHISPLAAYDAKSDSFLMLDVNPVKADWSWIPAADLVAAMNTFDTIENRGYVLVSER